MSEPLRVCITGAAGQIVYSLVYSIAKGDVFGPNQPIILHLLDIEVMMGVLKGVVMEITDCALPLVKDVIATSDVNVAFKDIDVAVLVGAMPRREGMERKDLLKANVKIFKQQGEALNQHAKKTVKVLVVGNPANTNCFICKKYAPTIPKKNFTCLTRLDQNRAQAQVANRLGVSPLSVKNTIIWGNHSSTQFPDCRHAMVTINGVEKKVEEALNDDNWLKNDFIKTVQTRGGAVIQARKLSSAMSAAKAICDHLRDWWCGTEEPYFVSMGVVSDGSYGIKEGLIYSFPLKITPGGDWSIVQDLHVNDFARAKMDITMKELEEEGASASEFCSQEAN